MNKKGFTLIELLAVIVILGVILVIAIPSISRAILNSRKNAYVVTANEFVDGLRLMTLNDSSLLPSGSDPSCKRLSEIKLEKGSNTKSPFGKEYDEDEEGVTDLTKSRVCVSYDDENKDYVYSVCLLDKGGNSICDIKTENEVTTNNPIDIKTVTKDTVVTGSGSPSQDNEEEANYVSDGMILWLDGINNTSSGHSSSTNTWYDKSGNSNSPTFNTNGTIDWNDDSFTFNGSASSYFNFPSSLEQFQNNNWTVEMRVTKETTSEDIIIGETKGVCGYQTFSMFFASNDNHFTVYDGQYCYNDTRYISSFEVSLNIPTTISVTYNSGALKFYKDGVYYNTIYTTPSYQLSNYATKTLGNYTGEPNVAFNGDLYSLRIYNKALSDDDIANNYAVDQTKF